MVNKNGPYPYGLVILDKYEMQILFSANLIFDFNFYLVKLQK